ncbi:MAG: rhodanese-like domain-containing protein [Magnetococcales bacterium]|nr:rhodanese-like domain-containing protein [Magnetococcales bacterium]
MAWLQQNGLMLFMLLMFLMLTLRGPILGRYYRVVHISVHDLAARLQKKSSVVLDVRTAMEFETGAIAGVKNVPLSQLKAYAEGMKDKDADVIVVCRSGARSLTGAIVLKRAGFSNVSTVSGGLLHWESQGYPVRR